MFERSNCLSTQCNQHASIIVNNKAYPDFFSKMNLVHRVKMNLVHRVKFARSMRISTRKLYIFAFVFLVMWQLQCNNPTNHFASPLLNDLAVITGYNCEYFGDILFNELVALRFILIILKALCQVCYCDSLCLQMLLGYHETIFSALFIYLLIWLKNCQYCI